MILRPSDLLIRLAFPAVLAAALGPALAAETQPLNERPKAIVVPLSGAMHYGMVADEFDKIARAVTVQKPQAVILVISSPGGSREIAFDLADRIARLDVPRKIAYVSGEHGGAFGAAAFVAMACDEVFVAPDNTIALQPVVNDVAETSDERLSPRQISLLQTWAARHRRSWSPVGEWLTGAGLIAPNAGENPTPGSAPTTQSAKTDRQGIRALEAVEAIDIDQILAQVGLADAWVIRWPDPVAKSNTTMQRMFNLADDLVKTTNSAIEAARQSDPRDHRYELRDIQREYSIGTIILPPNTGDDTATEIRRTDRVIDHNVFADGGESWRAYTDRCISYVRDAIATNRRLSALVARYPEIPIDPAELASSQEVLRRWLNQLRVERSLLSPPGNP